MFLFKLVVGQTWAGVRRILRLSLRISTLRESWALIVGIELEVFADLLLITNQIDVVMVLDIVRWLLFAFLHIVFSLLIYGHELEPVLVRLHPLRSVVRLVKVDFVYHVSCA